MSQKSFLTLPHITRPLAQPLPSLQTHPLSGQDSPWPMLRESFPPSSILLVPEIHPRRACLRDTIGLHSEGYACCEGKEQNNSRNLSKAFKSAPPKTWISSPRVRYVFTGLIPRNCLRVRINILQLSSGKFRTKCALTKKILKDE